MSVRLAAVSYLNARPLTHVLESEPGPFELAYAVPSRCAVDLHAGRADLGIIPSIEYARGPEPYAIVPDRAIAAWGPVLTVRLYVPGPLERVRRVALDTSSRTSAALVRILLRERYHLQPAFVDAAPDLEAMLCRADAALLIGDAVFRYGERVCPSIDLGEAWFQLTGLPFVLALWAGRPSALDPVQAAALVQAGLRGEAQAPEIALRFSHEHPDLHLPPAFFERYLTRHIGYELGPAELGGLRTFYALAQRHGLIRAIPSLRFYPVAAGAATREPAAATGDPWA
ncbi:MAG: menaquinone biosynthesis protein [Candidatus Latescibacterota bacterium]